MDDFFARLVWSDDRVVVDDLVFRFDRSFQPDEVDPASFRLYKGRELVDEYERFWSGRGDVQPKSILELGIYDGGSIAFWNECFHPTKHLGVDIRQRGDSEYFVEFAATCPVGSVKTFWGVDQGDAVTLRGMIQREFPEGLDLVIDDASHRYHLTRASFETIFPRLQPGALYIIEDWGWGHWNRKYDLGGPSPTRLVTEVTQAIGTSTGLIGSVTIYHGFAVVERGVETVEHPDSFSLADHITTRSQVWRARTDLRLAVGRAERPVRRAVRKAKRVLGAG